MRPYKLALAITLCLIVILYGSLVAAMPSQLRRGAFDFLAFYTGGLLIREHGLQQLYNLDLQRSLQSTIMGRSDFIEGGILPFNHVPVVASLAVLVAGLGFETAYLGWAGLMTACVLGAGLCFAGTLAGHSRLDRLLLVTGLLLQYPLFTSVLKGQDSALLLLGLGLAGWGLVAKRFWALGVGMALLCIKPHYALLFILPLLISRHAARWHALGCSLAFALLNAALVGPQGITDFLGVLLLSGSTESSGMNPSAMINFIGISLRLLPISLGDVQLIKWLIYVAGLLFLLWRWRQRGAALPTLALTAAMAPLIVPHAHVHDLAFLIPGWLLISVWLIQKDYQRLGLWFATVCSLFLLFSSVLNEAWMLNGSVLMACATVFALLRMPAVNSSQF